VRHAALRLLRRKNTTKHLEAVGVARDRRAPTIFDADYVHRDPQIAEYELPNGATDQLMIDSKP
jgi:hypothetical protein